MSRYDGPTSDVALREALNYAAGNLDDGYTVHIIVEHGATWIEAGLSDGFTLAIEPDGELGEEPGWLADGVRKAVKECAALERCARECAVRKDVP